MPQVWDTAANSTSKASTAFTPLAFNPFQKRGGRSVSFAADPVADLKLIPMDVSNQMARESVPYNEDPSDEEEEDDDDAPAGAIPLPEASPAPLPPPPAPPTAADVSEGGGEDSGAGAVPPSATAPFGTGKKKKSVANPFG